MLSSLTDAFEKRNPGVASFETFAADCLAEMKADPANASLYFLLSLSARQTHDRFADQPLTVEHANAAKTRLLDLARKAETAIAGDAETKVALLNDMAVEAFGAD